MYSPPQFKEHDDKEIRDIIDQFPLATLVCYSEGEFVANQIPFLRSSDGEYTGHIEFGNSQKARMAVVGKLTKNTKN